MALFAIDDGLDDLCEIIAHLHQLGATLSPPVQQGFTIPSIRVSIVLIAVIPLVVIDIDKLGVRVFPFQGFCFGKGLLQAADNLLSQRACLAITVGDEVRIQLLLGDVVVTDNTADGLLHRGDQLFLLLPVRHDALASRL
ncbi:hypothetical protein D3C76_904840 [compost metagenome]